jgi:RHS repeat-associated protein
MMKTIKSHYIRILIIMLSLFIAEITWTLTASASPLRLTDNIEGFYDGKFGYQNIESGGCMVGGWAVDSDNKSYRVSIRAMTDYGHPGQYSTQLATTTANGYRPDLTGECTGGYCSFGIDLRHIIPAVNTSINIRVEALSIEGHWVSLYNSPGSINCNDNWDGFYDGNSGNQSYANCYANGWAKDKDNTASRVPVRVMTDYGHSGQYTTQIGTATANQYRSDLTSVCSGGYCAYSINIGPNVPVLNTNIGVIVQMQSIEGFWDTLNNSPRTINCQDTSSPGAPIYDSNSVSISSGGWLNQNGITINWHGTNNPSGIDGYYLYEGQNPNGTSTTSFINVTPANNYASLYWPFDSSQGIGPYYLRAQSHGRNGQTSAWSTLLQFYFDSTPPTLGTYASPLSGGGWNSWTWYTNPSITVTPGCSDSGSGIGGQYISTYNGGWTSSLTLTSTSDIWANCYNNAGLSSISNIGTLHIDNILPTGSISENPTTCTNSQITFTLHPTDNGGSGVKDSNLEIYVLPDNVFSCQGGNDCSIQMNRPGNGSVGWTIDDNANNRSSGSVHFDNDDRSTPTDPTSAIENNQHIASNTFTTYTTPSFSWTASTDSVNTITCPGVKQYNVCWSTDNGCTAKNFTVTSPTFTPSALTKAGLYTLRVQSEDYAGNKSNWVSAFTYDYGDYTPPTIPQNIGETHGVPSNIRTNYNQPTFTWTASTDARSGIDHYAVYWGTTSNSPIPSDNTPIEPDDLSYQLPTSLITQGTYYFEVFAVDAWNNTSLPSIQFVYLFGGAIDPKPYIQSMTLGSGTQGALTNLIGIAPYSSASVIYGAQSSGSFTVTIRSGGGPDNFTDQLQQVIFPNIFTGSDGQIINVTGDEVTSSATYTNTYTISNLTNSGVFTIQTKTQSGQTWTATLFIIKDMIAPTVSIVPPTNPDVRFTVTWIGDDPGGLGVAGYNVQNTINCDSLRTNFTWQNQLTSLTALNTLTLDSDPMGCNQVRVQAVDNAGNTSAWVTTGWIDIKSVTKYYQFNSQTIATRQEDPANWTAGNVSYITTDQVGSVVATTGTDGAIQSQARYYPYGQVSWSSGTSPTDRTYTGQKSTDFGLMDYNARMYDPQTGRFISPDTVIPDPKNPKAFDRYGYGYNNPITHNDPSGHDVDCPGRDASTCPKSNNVVIIACGQNETCAFNSELMKPYFDYAVNQGYQVYIYNNGNFGANGTNKKDMASAISSKVNDNPDDSFVLEGHSAGADAVIYANYLSDYTDKIKGNVLLEPSMNMSLNKSDMNPHQLQFEADKIPAEKIALASSKQRTGITIIDGVQAKYFPFTYHDSLAMSQNVFDWIRTNYDWFR